MFFLIKFFYIKRINYLKNTNLVVFVAEVALGECCELENDNN